MDAVEQKATDQDQFRQTLGNSLARLRNDRKLTQEALAAAAGIHRVTLARIETGRMTPASDVLAALAKVLKSSVDDLLSGNLTPTR